MTGGSGSGKSYIAARMVERGAKWVDADAVYHKLLAESRALRNAILAQFPAANDGSGHINRKKLAAIVFTNDKALMELNAITHPFVIRAIEEEIGEYYRCNQAFAVIDAVALFESGLNQMCDATIGVLADVPTRVRRIMARDGLDETRARARIAAQQKDEFYRKKCDYIIENSDDSVLDAQIGQVLEKILEETE